MNSEENIKALLARVAAGEQSVDEALLSLRTLPFEDLGFAKVDHHREIRRGFPETIYCAGKTAEQVAEIAARLAKCGPRLLGTRATPDQFEAARKRVAELEFDEVARVIWMDREPERVRKKGVLIMAAGTSDLPVAEEAAITLDLMGHGAKRIYDVGVAGLHRLLAQLDEMRKANVVIVCAGMEGALPSVVAGLLAAPVIAVPTSIGYGASFQGLAALLGMLNSCSPGIGVVNIDNGYGAAHLAAAINSRCADRAEAPLEQNVGRTS
ncbi:MAG TPA: nickel pincer cofactor biosynthesis protein LarB [Tepidisphaeraceae bacterium]